MRLAEAFDINIGMVLSRKKAKQGMSNEYNYRVLTLKSMTEWGGICHLDLEDFISNSEIDPLYLTKKGDLIMRLTEPYSVAYITPEEEDLLVPSNFAIIRNNSNEFLSEFVQCYFNAQQGKNDIKRIATGSTLSAISIGNLKELLIERYSEEQQENFIRVNRLFLKEKFLLEQLAYEREKQLNGLNQQILRIEG